MIYPSKGIAGTTRICRLSVDMMSVDGEVATIPAHTYSKLKSLTDLCFSCAGGDFLFREWVLEK
jgi:hypothetical protein